MAGCLKCITTNLVWWLNLLFLIAGLGVIGCGVYVFVKPMADWAGKELSYAMFALGGFIFILSIFALIGAQRKVQKCAMWIYTILLTLLLLAQVAVVVIAFTQESLSKEFLLERWEENLDDAQRLKIMEEAKCGLKNPDWDGGAECKDNDCFEDCYEVFSNEFQNVGSVVAIVSIAIVGVEIILLIASCCLVCSDSDDDEEDGYGGNNFSV